jgi:hypothetical protein
MSVTKGVTDSSLPVNPFSGLSSNVARVDTSPPAAATGTLFDNSSLNDWLDWLGTQNAARITAIATNASSISTLDGRVTTAEGDITAIEGDIEQLQTDLDAAETAATTLAGRVTTVEGEVDTLQTGLSELEDAVDAIAVPSTSGLSNKDIAFWDGADWADATTIDFDNALNTFRLGGADSGHLGVRGATTNIFVVQQAQGSDIFVVPQTGAIRSEERDVRITEAGTAAKGFVTKDRTTDVYKRIYVTNGVVTVENA